VLTWNLGTVTDSDVSDDTDGTITLRYQAVVLNVASNQANTLLDNSATFQWGGDASTAVTVDADDVTVREAVVSINNTVIVAGNPGQTTGDAGDSARYTITLSNTGPVDAFDLDFVDAIPTVASGNSAITGVTFSVADSAGLLSASDFVLSGSDATGYTLSLGSSVDFDLLKSQTGRVVTITVDGTISNEVSPNQSITNTPTVQWTSLNGDVATRSSASSLDDGERDGTNAADTRYDYTANDPAPITINAATFVKSLFSTDQTETSGTNVTIGEEATFAFVVQMPEGTSPGLVIEDQLPAGLIYSGYSFITDAASSGGLLSADFAGTIGTPTVTGGATDGADVQFTFGTINTTVDNDPNNNAFVILVTAQVSDVATNVGYGSGQTTLTNVGTIDVPGDSVSPVSSNQVDIEVVESNLTITKNIVALLANAGDTMTIELSVANTGLGDAYDVTIQDILSAAQYDRNSVTLGASGVDYPSSFTANYVSTTGNLSYSGGTIAAGATATFTFTVDLLESVATDAVLANTATIEDASTLSGTEAGERNDTDPDSNGSDTSSDSVRIREHSLAGFVYFDADNDGVKDIAETGILGVDVKLQGTDHLGNNVDTTIQTLADGSYSFVDLRPGTYSITQTQPVIAASGKDYLDGLDTVGTQGGNGSTNDTFTNIVLPLTSELDGVNNNFGELEEAELRGFVYHDADNDATKDPAESGIGGVTVTLSGVNDFGAIATQNVVTNGDGSYSFDKLRPGTYTVTQTQPTFNAPSGRAYADGRDTDGSLNNGDVSINDTNSSIELIAANTAIHYNFGEVVRSVISGYVYHDTNNDGSRTGETGLGGVTVRLTGTDDLGAAVDITTTTSSAAGTLGYYAFAGLRPSDSSGYVISETTPAGYLDGIDSAGSQGGTLGSDTITSVVVSDTNGTENNFGEVLPSSLSGFVFNDKDNDGLFGGTDVAIGGASIALSGTDDIGNSVNLVTTTNGTGAYSFANLRPSNASGYRIVETQPTNFVDGIHSDGSLGNGDTSTSNVINSINLNQDTNGTQYNFGERGIGIGGTVFLDDSRDGVLQGDEPTRVSGVTIQLWDATGTTLLESQVTGADGSYLFTDRSAGDYQIVQLQPGLYTTTSPNTLNVTLPLTGLTDQNFGEALWDIGNTVWFDVDGDGVQSVGEPGLGNVEVTLHYAGAINTFGDGDDETSTTFTDANGAYQFFDRFNGEYRVTVTAADLPLGMVGTFETDDSSVAINGTSNISVAGRDRLDVDFGYRGTGEIGDLVWLDTDGDGVRQSGEPGLADVSVRLTHAGLDGEFGTTDDFDLQTVTGGLGGYLFDHLPAGDYRVSVDTADPDLPVDIVAILGPDSKVGTVDVSLSTGGVDYDQDFGFAGTLSIGDTVFIDHNADGGVFDIADGDRGIAGTLVTLDLDFDGDGNFDHQLTTLTDANGRYSFDHLIAGDYRVTVDESMLGNSVVTTSTHEFDPVLDSQSLVTLLPTRSRDNVDFGYPGQVDYAVTNTSSLTKAARGGDSFNYEVIVTNTGQRDGTGVFVTDTLPVDILDPNSIVSDDPANTIFDPNTGDLRWNVGDLDVGQSRTLVLTVSVPLVPADPLADQIVTVAVVSDDGFNGPETTYENNIASTLDELTTFAFDSFQNFSKDGHEDHVSYGLPAAALTHDRMLRPMPVDPIFSGLA
ncbi:MAG: SdrD B-like domain-containing protein, partial [Rubripirellula sp.]